ncbi:MAG: Hpt domain-containing protein [Gammaproteobacteria bacterium]|nr:Hpt domain-containing protein [Gammaproteobacteria bacterium]
MPLIDWQALQQAFANREQLMNKILQSTLEHYQHTDKELEQLVNKQAYQPLADLAHKLKSVTGNIKAMELYQFAVELESSARAENPDALRLAIELAGKFSILMLEIEATVSNKAG